MKSFRAEVVDLSSISLGAFLSNVKSANIRARSKANQIPIEEAESIHGKAFPLHEYQRLQYLIEATDDLLGRSETVLEIGPGRLYYARYVSSEYRSAILTLLDINKISSKHLPQSTVIYKSSVADMPIADKSQDLTVCTEVLEHIPPEIFSQALEEIKRVSKHYIISLPFLEREPTYKGHLNRFSAKQILDIFPNESKALLLKPNQGCPIICLTNF